MEKEAAMAHLSLDTDPPAVIHSSSAGSNSKKKKKKKKNSSGKCTLQLLTNTAALPSQHLVESHFPWKIAVRSKRGRCAIATRDIKAGELVISEKALAFVLRSNYRTAACHACCADISDLSLGVQCAVCKCTLFCQQCGKAAVSHHNAWCPVFKNIYAIAEQSDCDGDLLRLVLTLASRRNSEDIQVPDGGVDMKNLAGVSKDGVVQSSFQDAMALQTHRDKVSVAWRSSVRKGCEALHDCMLKQNENLKSSIEDLEVLAALINANAHGMGAQGLHNTDIAIGIFPFVSMLNHSCRPNCCFYSEGDVMHVRATQDIPQDKELCLSYINLYESRTTRRDQLLATKHFECRCSRCVEPISSSVDRFLEGVLCNVKGCGGVVVKKVQEAQSTANEEPLALWQCDSCSGILDPTLNSPQNSRLNERPWDLVAQAQEKLHAAILVYKERQFKDARIRLENFISEFSGKLHPLHVLLFDALTPLMNCCRVLGDAESGVRVCRNIISCMEKVLTGPSLELANFYFCLAEMCSECAEAVHLSPILVKRYKKQAQEAFHQVRHIRQICHGRATLPS